ncbi:hypothetical protein Trydic_g12515 [Trypoxylus dichotomus]
MFISFLATRKISNNPKQTADIESSAIRDKFSPSVSTCVWAKEIVTHRHVGGARKARLRQRTAFSDGRPLTVKLISVGVVGDRRLVDDPEAGSARYVGAQTSPPTDDAGR